MKRLLFCIITVSISIFLLINLLKGNVKDKLPEKDAVPAVNTLKTIPPEEPEDPITQERFLTITGIVRPRDTMEAIFDKHNLNKADLSAIYRSSRKKYNLSRISVGSVYAFEIDREKNRILSMQYGINDLTFLNVTRKPEGFSAENVKIPVDKRTGSLYIYIKGNLMNSMPGNHREYRRLAHKLSEIYAWDIDFSSDIRNGDTVKIIVEELWVGEAFKGYGNILAAEFVNNGQVHAAYRFGYGGHTDYYDREGKSVKKTLLRSPLKFKYISSRFSRRRFHPKLKTYRPHLAVDYAAPTGTPVSAAGSGTVVFAGYRGQSGKMVRIRHRGGYETYYGHLSKIPRNIRRGARVEQGDIIGYVGSTGLVTGPHLDYRIKLNGRFVNPLKIHLPQGKSVPENLMAEFRKTVSSLDSRLALLKRPVIAFTGKKKKTSS